MCRVCVFPAGFGSNIRIMVGSASGPGSTFKALLGSARVRVPLSNKTRVRVGSVQHIYGSLRVRVRIFGPVKTSTLKLFNNYVWTDWNLRRYLKASPQLSNLIHVCAFSLGCQELACEAFCISWQHFCSLNFDRWHRVTTEMHLSRCKLCLIVEVILGTDAFCEQTLQIDPTS